MPELPEVETIRRGLVKIIKGKTVKAVEVRLPKIVALGPAVVSNIRKTSVKSAQSFCRFLTGQKIISIKRRAKLLLIELSPISERSNRFQTRQSLSNSLHRSWGEGKLWLLVHLKMTGQLILAKPGERKKVKIMNFANSPVLQLPHKYTHVIFTFTDGSKLFYNDLRQFGYMRLVRRPELPEVKELSEYGPEPFSKEFSLENFWRKARTHPKLTIKQYLVDPKIVAGIGNIYSDEILYCAKLRPTRKVLRIKNQELIKIHHCIRNILRQAIKARGSSVGEFFKVDGTEGTFGRQHMVYGRYGEKCKKCGRVIARVKLGGRTASYCPKCQK